MPQISVNGQQVNITDTNQQDSRGFSIFSGPDGALYTQQDGTFVLSRPADIASTLPSTGDENIDKLIGAFEQGVQSTNKRINPQITFNPGEISGFLDQAIAELNPFFQSQFKAIRTDLEEGLGELQQSLDLQAEAQAQGFRGGLKDIRESAAERGLGISGVRASQEREFAESTSRGIEQATNQALASSRIAGREVERRIGTENLASVNIPGIRALDVSGFQPGITFAKQAAEKTTDRKPLFELSKEPVKGSLVKQQQVEQRVRASEIEAQERTRRLNTT